MVALNPPVCDFGWPAPSFDLPGTDGRRHTLASVAGPRGLLVVFMCNHCPFVKAIIHRLIRDARDLAAQGVATVAIMSNDTVAYPDDAFPQMVRWAEELDFPFPYLYDETQAVARAYGAVCTPDFFGFNADLALQYRGRLDASGRDPSPSDTRRELFDAMSLVASTGRGPESQTPSIGCSIKWRSGV
ncbi:MAG TPA: thioredoxin family protein [Rhodocyclaceae bacterium]|jgi:peroxiredoxin|nr:thioredoxin family protein [Rhodocyclaceae bacterium]HMW76309.1 thioredoxin family protein [Rhodocyclaceae bacterium]HNE42403.1 thioredoxin family protein [Rhodocyclaceae bacterium]HNL20444.1 thioredoxin family protein [Rhodocyclaceae bacterium]HNM21457.1 thioredoxin family protein [Rhodocyclaceae bacterium]